MKQILLLAWAEKHYDPPPSLWTLRKLARQGEIFPPPEKVGRDWYVFEDARRQTAGRPSLVSRL